MIRNIPLFLIIVLLFTSCHTNKQQKKMYNATKTRKLNSKIKQTATSINTKDIKKHKRAIEYFKDGSLEKSIIILEELIVDYPEWSTPYITLTKIYSKQGSNTLTLKYLKDLYDINKKRAVSGFDQIIIDLYNTGKYDLVLFYSKNLLQIDSSFLKRNILLSNTRNVYGVPVYTLTGKKIINNCDFALDAIEKPVIFEAKNLGDNINSEFAEYLPNISADNNLFFVTRRLESDGYSNEEFFLSRKDKEDKWTKAIRLDQPINTYQNEGALSLSPDGSLLVFTACDRRSSYGGCDLYFSVKNNKWSNPSNLGEHINSRFSDKQPCFSADGKYLYFVSNRPGGLGGLDIWKTKIEYSDFGIVKFSNPENLGSTINTSYDEMSPFIHPDNLTLYFSSRGHLGMGDYDLYISRRSNSEEKWGEVKNLGFPINTFKVENSLIVASNGKTAYYASDQSGYGKEDIFYFELPKQLQANEILELEMDIITKTLGEEIILENVNFANNSSIISSESFNELNTLIEYLFKNPSLKITIEGHTDNIGSVEDNMILSSQRAASVYQYLLNNGLDSIQVISHKGYGENKPLEDNSTIKGRAQNRRTSFRIIR